MPKGTNQKLKLYYLAKIMVAKTDELHGLTLAQIREELEEYGVTADRKSLYDDMEALRELGIEVVGEQAGKYYVYYVAAKKFDLAELQLLADALSSSKQITDSKVNELIRKLAGMTSEYEAGALKRQGVVQGRIRTMNDSVYANVDELSQAITSNRQVEFEYMQWNLQKKMESASDESLTVSPWALFWSGENCYLVAYLNDTKKIEIFRVDQMRDILVLDQKRAGKDNFKQFDLTSYTKDRFGVYGGKNEKVKIKFNNEIVGEIIEQFGKDVDLKASAKGWSEANIDVMVNDQFYGWVFSQSGNVKIVQPKKVKDEFKTKLNDIINQFE